VAGIQISHPGRVLYPDQGATKVDLAHYYQQVAERMLPHVAARPLSIVRCPKGWQGKCFYQKHLTDQLPEAVKGVASIGVRPTVPGPARSLLEVHLLDFDADLYGRRLEVGFVEKIRDEERFEDFDALRTQIAADIKQAERLFERRNQRASTA